MNAKRKMPEDILFDSIPAAFLCGEKHAFQRHLRSIQGKMQGKGPKQGTFLKFFLVYNEWETTFFQKNVKKGLAFFRKVEYNNISF